jgi:hypothetical protein
MRKTSKGFSIYLRLERPERQMGAQGVHTKGVFPFLVGSLVSLYRNKIFLSCLGCSNNPNTKHFFLNAQISLHLSPSPSKLQGRQSCRVSLIFISVSAGGDPDVKCPIWQPLCSSIFFRDTEHFFRYQAEFVLRHSLQVSDYFFNSFYNVGHNEAEG